MRATGVQDMTAALERIVPRAIALALGVLAAQAVLRW